MRTPKKWLQDWLGLTSLAKKVAEIDAWRHPMSYKSDSLKGVSIEVRNEVPEGEAYLISEKDLMIVKGYDKP